MNAPPDPLTVTRGDTPPPVPPAPPLVIRSWIRGPRTHVEYHMSRILKFIRQASFDLMVRFDALLALLLLATNMFAPIEGFPGTNCLKGEWNTRYTCGGFMTIYTFAASSNPSDRLTIPTCDMQELFLSWNIKQSVHRVIPQFTCMNPSEVTIVRVRSATVMAFKWLLSEWMQGCMQNEIKCSALARPYTYVAAYCPAAGFGG